jgi:hypothetical protein
MPNPVVVLSVGLEPEDCVRFNEYVDVRGKWPLYIFGLKTLRLEGYLRSITLERARVVYAKWLSTGELPLPAGHERQHGTQHGDRN